MHLSQSIQVKRCASAHCAKSMNEINRKEKMNRIETHAQFCPTLYDPFRSNMKMNSLEISSKQNVNKCLEWVWCGVQTLFSFLSFVEFKGQFDEVQSSSGRHRSNNLQIQ